jgi:hypothetical protein
MEPKTPDGIVFDGTNHDEVLGFMRQYGSDNQPVRGGGHLEPPAPGEARVIQVELLDGRLVTYREGDTVLQEHLTFDTTRHIEEA